MKKLSLKNAKNLLSRKEMKAINGGYYSASPGCGEECGDNGVVCQGTCGVCGPACTCIEG